MFFRNRIYGNRVLECAVGLITQDLGKDDGQEAAEAFLAFTRRAMKAKELDFKPLISHLRKSNYTVRESAVVIIDGTISQIKEAEKMPHLSQSEIDLMRNIVCSLEKVVDNFMRTSPGKFLPRNGRFAEAAQRSGFDRFVSTR